MDLFIGIVQSVADGILMALQIALLVRAVMSWFPMGENIITDVAYGITEPIIIPIRRVLERFESVRNFPFDISFYIAFVIVTLLSSVLFP